MARNAQNVRTGKAAKIRRQEIAQGVREPDRPKQVFKRGQLTREGVN